MSDPEQPVAEVTPTKPPVDPLVGQVLDGRFRLTERLGEGSMGAVYRAEQQPAGREVAVKVLRPSFSDPITAERFRREARALLHLAHPHIVTAIDFGQAQSGLLYLAMERLEGRPLRAFEGGALPLMSVLEIGIQVCRALVAAHATGVIHRDLKPDNIFVTSLPDQPLHVKVLDFGLAKLVDESVETQLTQSGFIVGTPQYMAPEQADGSHIDHRADLYSLGVVLFELLSGRPPFEGENMAKLLRSIISDPVPPLPSSLPPGLRALVESMLAKEPAARPADATKVLHSLEQAVAEASGKPVHVDVPMLTQPAQISDHGLARTQISPKPFEEPSSIRQRPTSRLWMGLAVSLTLAVVSYLAWAFWPR